MANLFEYQAASMPSWWDGNFRQEYIKTTLNNIAGDGASQVVIVPTVYMDSLTSTRVYRDNGDPGGHNVDGAPRTESDGSIRVAIAEAKARGVDPIFKLHVNMQNDDWNALIGPPAGSTPEQATVWADQWFASYTDVAVHYAKLAQQEGLTTFAIGNECESMTGPQYREYWVSMIEAIRAAGYTGKLTYAATWTEAFDLSFWDKLDYVGVNPYISFTANNTNPTVQQLVDGWTKPSTVDHVRNAIIEGTGKDQSAIDALRELAISKGKPLVFTEAGFRSMDGNNITPWQWGNGTIDPVEQANMFKAFFKILTDYQDNVLNDGQTGWLAGYWLWNYDAGEAVNDPSPDDGYSTHGKLADAIVEHYMKNPIAVDGRVLNGTAAGEVLKGGFNKDTIDGGAGNDTLTGGHGGDVFVYATGGGADTITDFQAAQGDKIRLATGAKTFADLQIAAVADGYVVTFTNGDSLTIKTTGTPVAGWFEFGAGSSGTSTKPTKGNDQITGTSKANRIDALAGNDSIDGLGGNDTLSGGSGDDTVLGGSGADQLYGSSGNDALDGGSSNDRLSGGDGEDMLAGGTGNDTVYGGRGLDLLNGNEGNDILYGEDGDDLMTGGVGNDIMKGGNGNDKVAGEDGNDKLYGDAGDDILEGWFGDDQLWGGSGNDVLASGSGNDKLWGGTGVDKFVFGDGMGLDTIHDFSTAGKEMLIVQGNLNGTGIGSDLEDWASLTKLMRQEGKNTVIDFGESQWGTQDKLTLVNVKMTELTRDHFWFW